MCYHVINRGNGRGEAFHQEQPEAQLLAIRNCIRRGAPLGKPEWIKPMAAKLGLSGAIHPTGRPRKKVKK